MIKRILIASLLLFMPIFANAETLVIGSSESFKERNLPLDTRLLSNLYSEDVCRGECYRHVDILTYFVDGKINVPFSAKELLKLCRRNTFSFEFGGMTYCRGRCTDFVIDYLTEISRKEKDKAFDAGRRDIAYNSDNMKLAAHKFIDIFDHCDTPMAFGEDRLWAYINDYVIEQGIESISSKELLKKCKDYYMQYYEPDFCVERCSFFVTYYKNLMESE